MTTGGTISGGVGPLLLAAGGPDGGFADGTPGIEGVSVGNASKGEDVGVVGLF